MIDSPRAGKYGPLHANHINMAPTYSFTELTVGTVVDTNDPQQMGRLRVMCPRMGDTDSTEVANIPWASYVSPIGGIDRRSSRGRGENFTSGPVSYGMWSIPKQGASVLIACIDGSPRHRVWLGCMHQQFLPHTMPHGRYIDGVNGPVSSREELIFPLAASQDAAFGGRYDSYEYKSRAMDGQVASIGSEFIQTNDSFISSKPDGSGEPSPDQNSDAMMKPGYKVSRLDPNLPSGLTASGENMESQVHSWTTPGFHAIAMDDSEENCRIRIRTTHGAQILLDDTNERIYISTANGKSWIEMDESGNIDVYSEKRISMHAKQDINIQSDKTVRIQGAEGVHIQSDKQVRVHGKDDVHVSSGATLNLTSASVGIKADVVVDGATLIGGLLSAVGQAKMNVSGTSSNTPEVSVVNPGVDDALESFKCMRAPKHEPWARGVMDESADGDSNNTQTPEFPYDSDSVGKVERGETIKRNRNWRR
jgi:phage gp45-like